MYRLYISINIKFPKTSGFPERPYTHDIYHAVVHTFPCASVAMKRKRNSIFIYGPTLNNICLFLIGFTFEHRSLSEVQRFYTKYKICGNREKIRYLYLNRGFVGHHVSLKYDKIQNEKKPNNIAYYRNSTLKITYSSIFIYI